MTAPAAATAARSPATTAASAEPAAATAATAAVSIIVVPGAVATRTALLVGTGISPGVQTAVPRNAAIPAESLGSTQTTPAFMDGAHRMALIARQVSACASHATDVAGGVLASLASATTGHENPDPVTKNLAGRAAAVALVGLINGSTSVTAKTDTVDITVAAAVARVPVERTPNAAGFDHQELARSHRDRGVGVPAQATEGPRALAAEQLEVG